MGLWRNFFHIELGDDAVLGPLVEIKVLELKYGKMLLQVWSPGFNLVEEDIGGEEVVFIVVKFVTPERLRNIP